jgi:hypothetical protein
MNFKVNLMMSILLLCNASQQASDSNKMISEKKQAGILAQLRLVREQRWIGTIHTLRGKIDHDLKSDQFALGHPEGLKAFENNEEHQALKKQWIKEAIEDSWLSKDEILLIHDELQKNPDSDDKSIYNFQIVGIKPRGYRNSYDNNIYFDQFFDVPKGRKYVFDRVKRLIVNAQTGIENQNSDSSSSQPDQNCSSSSQPESSSNKRQKNS